MTPRHIGAFAAAWWCLSLTSAAGQTGETAAPADAAWTLRTSLKSSLLFSRLPDDPALFPERDNTTGLFRLRIEPSVRVSDAVSVEAAFEQRLRLFTSTSGLAGAAVLPVEAEAPYRIAQVDWQFAGSSHAAWRGEIDRAAVHLHSARADVTAGRQAVGWGRGVLFGAVDLFAPFSPLEADREWRRGVDAIRADVKLGDRSSLDTVAAFAETLDGSALVTRFRGYAGKADVEILGGIRARDGFLGATSSAAVGDIELHGEIALFRTPATPGSVAFADPRSIAKAVAGGSYRVPAGNGVLLFAEYHYSGFGATSPEGILPLLLDPEFQRRYLRGDTQILERHAIAVMASYEMSPEITLSNQWLQSPVDGSGVVAPSLTWTLSDRSSVLASSYLPYGREPIGATLESMYGAAALSALVQVRIYW